jgi:hypothetical protein
MIQEVNKNRNQNNAFTITCRQGIQNQLRRRKNTAAVAQDGAQPQPQSGKRKADDGSSSGQPGKRSIKANLVHFILRRHPSETVAGELERVYMRTSAEVKVRASMQLHLLKS